MEQAAASCSSPGSQSMTVTWGTAAFAVVVVPTVPGSANSAAVASGTLLRG